MAGGSCHGCCLALEEGEIQGADLNPTSNLGASPSEISQYPEDPQTQEEEESVVLNHEVTRSVTLLWQQIRHR